MLFQDLRIRTFSRSGLIPATTQTTFARSVVLALPILFACGGEPYRPACTATPARVLAARPGLLAGHPKGRWTLATPSVEETDGSVPVQRVLVDTFSSAGEALDTRSFALGEPDASPLGVTLTAVTGGVATATPRSTPDGGLAVIVKRYDADGGTVVVEVPVEAGFGLSSLALAEVGDALHVVRRTSGTTEVVALSLSGEVLGRRKAASPLEVVAGSDATMIGNDLLSPSLMPVGTRGARTGMPSSGFVPSEVVTWDLESRQWAIGTLQGESVLLEQFPFDEPAGTPRRVSSGSEVLSVSLGVGGAAALFTAASPEFVRPVWFATVDATGTKRGPDVSVSADLFGRPALAPLGESSFGVFFQSPNGLFHREVRCE